MSAAGAAPRAAVRLGVLTISDGVARGERTDRSGDVAAAWAAARGDVLAARACVADDQVAIARQLAEWCDADVADVVVTTGGTGLARRDVTPEATRVVIEREAPGLSERIRQVTGADFPRAALSRGVAGVRARTLIVNLPGSPNGVRQALDALAPVLDHARDVLRDRPTDHTPVPDRAGTGAGA